MAQYEQEADVMALRRTPGGGNAILDAARGTGRKAVPVVPSRSKKKICAYKSSNGKCKQELNKPEDAGRQYCEHHRCPITSCFGFKGSRDVACAPCTKGDQDHLRIEHAPPPPSRRASQAVVADEVAPPPPSRRSLINTTIPNGVDDEGTPPPAPARRTSTLISAKTGNKPTAGDRAALARRASGAPPSPPPSSAGTHGAPRALGSVTRYVDSDEEATASESDPDDDGYMKPLPPKQVGAAASKDAGGAPASGGGSGAAAGGSVAGGGGAAADVPAADGNAGSDSDSSEDYEPMGDEMQGAAGAEAGGRGKRKGGSRAAPAGAGTMAVVSDAEDGTDDSDDGYLQPTKKAPASADADADVGEAGYGPNVGIADDGDIDPPEADDDDAGSAAGTAGATAAAVKADGGNMYDAGGGRRSIKVPSKVKKDDVFAAAWEAGRKVKCTHSFNPEEKLQLMKNGANQLVMQKGDVMLVVEDMDPGWWTVKDVNGKEGIIPANYVEEESDYEEYSDEEADVARAAADAAIQDAAAAESYLAPGEGGDGGDGGGGDGGGGGGESSAAPASQKLTLTAGPSSLVGGAGDGAEGGAGAGTDQFKAGAGAEPEDGYEEMVEVDDDEIVLKGWFKKRGEGKLARAQVRWFEMSGHEIRFYVKQNEPETYKNLVPLGPQTKATCKEKAGEGHQLRIEQPERTWRLMPYADLKVAKTGADAKKQVQDWRQMINVIIKRKYGMTKHTTDDSEA